MSVFFRSVTLFEIDKLVYNDPAAYSRPVGGGKALRAGEEDAIVNLKKKAATNTEINREQHLRNCFQCNKPQSCKDSVS